MKFFVIPLFLAITAFAQTPAKIFTFSQADKEHCKVVVVSGKPLLESTFDGTSVAIAMPVNRGNGEFLVFVAISQVTEGSAKVDPKEMYGVFSDPAHSRFTFFDKGAEMGPQGRPGGDAGMSASSAQLDTGSVRPGQMMGGAPPGGGAMPGEADPKGGSSPGASMPSTYLRKSKVKQGNMAVGWVTLRQTKDANLEVHPNDMLDEIDIPVNGVVFRF